MGLKRAMARPRNNKHAAQKFRLLKFPPLLADALTKSFRRRGLARLWSYAPA
jgi:hypothetical protein